MLPRKSVNIDCVQFIPCFMKNSRCCQRFICKGLGVCGEGLGCMNGDCTIMQENCMYCYLWASSSFYIVIED